MKNKHQTYWGSVYEYQFIEGIGTHSEIGKRHSKKVWLEKYLQCAGLRSDWDGIAKAKVLNFVKEQIKGMK